MRAPSLTRLNISGYKSFAVEPLDDSGTLVHLPANTIDFGRATVLLGANGSGKSNVVSLFRLLEAMMTKSLTGYVAENGYADSIPHFGSRITPRMAFYLEADSGVTRTFYRASLSAVGDTLSINEESIGYVREDGQGSRGYSGTTARLESRLESASRLGKPIEEGIYQLLSCSRVYQFHDTSKNARLRNAVYIDDTGFLRSDGGNLAPFLLGLKLNHTPFYERIERTIQQVCPQFGGFVLAPSTENRLYIRLNWRDRNQPDSLMGPHQLSDGTLRFMALAALFLQPPELLPPVVVIDEPELGLHPMAIAVLAGLVRGVADHSQVILATQSETLVNHFEIDEIRPISISSGTSRFLHLAPEEYAAWLEDYTLGELWEKNVLGGGPRVD